MNQRRIGRVLLLGYAGALLAAFAPACNESLILLPDAAAPATAPDLSVVTPPDLAVVTPPDLRPPPDLAIPPDLAVIKPLVFSEIMYHPVDENAPLDNHEFIEIHNPAEIAVDLSGWKITGDVTFTFPPGARIAPHEYKVIAHNKALLAAVPDYKLVAADLFGDYTGDLANGGGTINLVDAKGATVDSATWSPAFPWPVGADALGAGDEWLSMLTNPLTSAPHKYRGRSLERVSPDVPSSEVSNWTPSPLDGATPGRANTTAGPPPAIVVTKTVKWSGADILIRAADTVTLGFTFSKLGPYKNPQLQYFVDNLQAVGEPMTTVPLVDNNGVWQATLPPQPSNAIVRYRVFADRGGGQEIISPRPSDPFEWWAYFVSPPIQTTNAIYHLFINKAQWNQMYDNVNFGTDDRRVIPAGNPVKRCTPRPSWDSTVPAVFVVDGVVYDAFVRYQGSRWNRTNGIALDVTKTTISPLPDRPNPYRVLSWKVDFPEYAPFQNKRKKMVLNKLNQACPGLDNAVAEQIYGDPSIGVPVQHTQFVRFYVNGGYYHYMMDIEHIDGDMIKRWRAPGEKTGDLFKADGNGGPDTIEGPWGMADERVLGPNADCPMWSIDDRYAYTYQRLTNSWDTPAELRKMIEAIAPLRAQAMQSGNWAPVRAWFMQNFDYQKTLDYLVIRNWAEPWDDQFHNHFLYQRASDKKWLIIPQDVDLEFGEYFGWAAGKSFFVGEEKDPDNRSGLWNRIKDAFIKAFRAEFMQRLVDLDANGVLNPTTYKAKVDVAAGVFSLPDYMASPAAANACNFTNELNRMKTFGASRHQDIVDILDAAKCMPGQCGLKGDYYVTAAMDMTRDFALATLKLTRTDATVNFDWGTAAADPTLPADGIQVRWTGKIIPRYTETYTIYTTTDDGARLWVNGVQLVNRWQIQGATESGGTIALQAGVPATVVMEYFDATGGASARLSWSSASQPKQIIPTSRLSPM